MAKVVRSMNFKNAEIDFENMILTETNKDDFEEFSLSEILKQWDKVPGLSILIKQECEFSNGGENTE